MGERHTQKNSEGERREGVREVCLLMAVWRLQCQVTYRKEVVVLFLSLWPSLVSLLLSPSEVDSLCFPSAFCCLSEVMCQKSQVKWWTVWFEREKLPMWGAWCWRRHWETVITMLAQSTGPCCMLKWLFGRGLREKVYLNHFMYVCVWGMHSSGTTQQ